MIRINLLPPARGGRARGASGDSTLWAGIYLVSAAALAGGLALYHLSRSSELEELRRANREVQAQVDKLNAETAQMAQLKAQLAESERVEGIIETLQRGRTGPTRVLMELRNILSEGRGPSIDAAQLEALRRENPNAGFDASWDVRRVALLSFTEEKGNCKITGVARTNRDVAEFLRRITLSSLFEDTILSRTEMASSKGPDGKNLINFELTCRVSY